MGRKKASSKNAATKGLAEQHIGLVFHWARACKRRKLYQDTDLADLIQEGYFGLVKAVQKYDPTKCQFSTYATKWIRKYIREFRLRSRGSGFVPCDSRRIDNLDIMDAEEAAHEAADNPLKSAIDSEMASTIACVVGALDERTRDIVTARFGILRRRETYREIGKRHGISGARVQQIEKKALAKMRKSELLSHLKTN